MKKAMFLMLASLFVVASLSLTACGDDDDAAGPCDELADKYMDMLDTVCADFPDCSICEPVEEGEEGEVDEEACQEALDAWTDEFEQSVIDGWTMVCEMEEDAA